MKVLRFIRDLARQFPWLLAGDVLLLVLEGLLGAVAVLTVAPLIDFFFSSDPQHTSHLSVGLQGMMRHLGVPTSLGGLLGVFLAFQVLKNAFTIFVRHWLIRTRYRVLRRLTLDTFEQFFNARWAFFSSHKQGTLLSALLYEMDTVGSAIGFMTLFVANLIQFVCYLAVPLWISWQVTAVSLVTALIFAIPLLMLGRLNYQLGQRGTSTTNQRSAVIQESFSTAKLILGFGNQDKHLHALAQAFDAHRWVAHRFMTIQAATPLCYEPLGIMVLILTVLMGQRLGISFSEIAVMLWALRNCMPLLGNMAMQRNSLKSFVASYEQIQRLTHQARVLRQRSGRRTFTGLQRGVTLAHVSFAYPGREPTLRDLNLVIPKGTLMALVGESGAGKSTVVDLLMGFHEPTDGSILVDDTPLPEFDIRSYRGRIGYVPQESVLFNASIRDNLQWAKPGATEEDIRQACCQAHAEEFIARLPDGYDTLVGDRGVRLSGGQCQRIALARAILRRPDLLILDEATSSLDSSSERLIQQAIEAIAKETTVIVIAHRLSTIATADAIYVLQHGRIIEEGTYQSLMQQSQGHFRRMTQLQVLGVAASPAHGGASRP